MQDLTFGEQVKIVLNRKNMTIKDLARQIEGRTKKKMSRQNLTQRLGRDNFQEQDMRMIADILGCPFQLNILEDRASDENAGNNIKGMMKEQTAEKALSEPDTAEDGDRKEKPAGLEPEKSGDLEAAGCGRAEPDIDRKKEPEEEEKKEPAEEEKKNSADQAADVSAHERDMTIGEFVDINEELDAMLKEAAGRQAGLRGQESEAAGYVRADRSVSEGSVSLEAAMSGESAGGAEEDSGDGFAGGDAGTDRAGYPDGSAAGYRDSSLERPEMNSSDGSSAGVAVKYGEVHPENSETGYERDHLDISGIGYEEGYPDGSEMSYEEGYPDGSEMGYEEGYPDGSEMSYEEGYPDGSEMSYEEGYPDGSEMGYEEGYQARDEKETVEELLEEIESLERTERKEEKKEEKPHGWRAYFMQRIRRRGKESAQQEESHVQEQAQSPDVDQDSEDYVAAEYVSEGYAQDGIDEEDYIREGYIETEYTQEGYHETGYSEERDIGQDYAGEMEGYGEYPAADYVQEAYQNEMAGEEEDCGDINPYTGREYESNSVRMHPSRIGYVQVYDRSIHKWTDMTEWAFLGYQERKKQLLGKDYDPPIYLD